MSVLCDKEIRRLAEEEEMIAPFQDRLISKENGRRILSYGLSSYGYDIRLSPEQCLIFGRISEGECDPKDFKPEILNKAELLEDEKGKYFLLPPYCYYGHITGQLKALTCHAQAVAVRRKKEILALLIF